jgi:hypothetical protein
VNDYPLIEFVGRRGGWRVARRDGPAGGAGGDGLEVAVSAQPRLRRAGRGQGVKYRCHVGGGRVNAPSSTSETRAGSIPAPAPLSVSIR